MKLVATLAIILVVAMVCSSNPLNMRKKKDGDEKAMPLNTDRNSHTEKRAKEVLMFGNQQNSPRVKKSDPKPDKEVPLTGLNTDEDSKEHRLTGEPEDASSNLDKSSSSSSSSTSSSSEELRNEKDDIDENKTEEDREESKLENPLMGDNLKEHGGGNSNGDDEDDDDSDSSHKLDTNDSDNNDDDDDMLSDDIEEELVNNDSDDDQDDDEDNNKYRASKKTSDLPLFPEDSIDADDDSASKMNSYALTEEQPLFPEDTMNAEDERASKLNSYALTKELPLLKPGEEMISERDLPELVKAGLEPSEANSYEHLMQEYRNAEPIDVQRERSFQENPLLNYIYRRRRELRQRSPRTKRGLYLPEDSQQYMQAEMPEKLVSLDSWPNAYTQSELLEKEAPYQIDNSELDGGYGYEKRMAADFERESPRIDEDSIADENDEEDVNMPYEEVVLNGQPGYFIPAKRIFYPYSEEPRSHYSGLIGNKRSEPEDDIDYSRLLELARALAVQRDGNSMVKEEDSFAEK